MNGFGRQLCQNVFIKAFKPTYVSNSFLVNPVILGVHLPSQYQPSRNAGHSKWANIKHVKDIKDKEKSKDMTKFVNLIKIAAKEGGSADPKMNSKLASVIAQIKSAKLPMGSFDKVLLNLQAKKEAKSALIPIKGPGRCTLIIDILSDNLNRAKQELNTILKKNGAILVDDSALHQFEHRGIIVSTDYEGKPITEAHLDDAIAHAIEAGADDVTFQTDHPDFGTVLEFTTAPSAFFRVKHALEKANYNIVHGDVEYIPINVIELDDENIQAALKLYEKLCNNPDVNRVYANIA